IALRSDGLRPRTSASARSVTDPFSRWRRSASHAFAASSRSRAHFSESASSAPISAPLRMTAASPRILVATLLSIPHRLVTLSIDSLLYSESLPRSLTRRGAFFIEKLHASYSPARSAAEEKKGPEKTRPRATQALCPRCFRARERVYPCRAKPHRPGEPGGGGSVQQRAGCQSMARC